MDPRGPQLGPRPVPASAARIAATGRGGYCFHLNGALAALLSALGYSVSLHVGGVHGPEGPSVEWLTNHLVLGVAGLPSDACPDGLWYVDVGLGDAMHDPMPWVAGPVAAAPSGAVARTGRRRRRGRLAPRPRRPG